MTRRLGAGPRRGSRVAERAGAGRADAQRSRRRSGAVRATSLGERVERRRARVAARVPLSPSPRMIVVKRVVALVGVLADEAQRLAAGRALARDPHACTVRVSVPPRTRLERDLARSRVWPASGARRAARRCA